MNMVMFDENTKKILDRTMKDVRRLSGKQLGRKRSDVVLYALNALRAAIKADPQSLFIYAIPGEILPTSEDSELKNKSQSPKSDDTENAA